MRQLRYASALLLSLLVAAAGGTAAGAATPAPLSPVEWRFPNDTRILELGPAVLSDRVAVAWTGAFSDENLVAISLPGREHLWTVAAPRECQDGDNQFLWGADPLGGYLLLMCGNNVPYEGNSNVPFAVDVSSGRTIRLPTALPDVEANSGSTSFLNPHVLPNAHRVLISYQAWWYDPSTENKVWAYGGLLVGTSGNSTDIRCPANAKTQTFPDVAVHTRADGADTAVVLCGDGTVMYVDGATGQLMQRIGGGNQTGTAVTLDGAYVAVLSASSSKVTVIDSEQLTAVATFGIEPPLVLHQLTLHRDPGNNTLTLTNTASDIFVSALTGFVLDLSHSGTNVSAVWVAKPWPHKLPWDLGDLSTYAISDAMVAVYSTAGVVLMNVHSGGIVNTISTENAGNLPYALTAHDLVVVPLLNSSPVISLSTGQVIARGPLTLVRPAVAGNCLVMNDGSDPFECVALTGSG